MKETIGGVTLNYEYNTILEQQEPNDFERVLLEIVRNKEDIEAHLLKETDERFLYHLSPIRQNVLRWFDFDKKASLLEIGAECGALTGFFCENVQNVVAVDVSKQHSIINATRNNAHENLEIYVGAFADINFEQRFDYVTLIGTLETESFLPTLQKIKTILKPKGKLLLAIENKYGLKYWAGAPEDYTGKLFGGIEGYEGMDKVYTFSKSNLKNCLEKAGFESNRFYYPVPDYKMAMEIYSEKHLPKPGDIKTISPAYDRPRYEFFDERLAYSSICEDGLFEEFANAFLVVCE